MSEAIDPQEFAERVNSLIARHDGGNVARAAQRIGVREDELRAAAAAESDQPSLHLLSALVRGYDVDAWWLISGDTSLGGEPALGALPLQRRVDTLNLLSDLGTALTLQRRSGCESRPVPPADIAEPSTHD